MGTYRSPLRGQVSRSSSRGIAASSPGLETTTSALSSSGLATSTLASSGLSRRGLLMSAGALWMLAACSNDASPVANTKANDRSDAQKRVRMASWPNYIDTAKDSSGHRQQDANGSLVIPSLREFTQQTGIRADYFEDVEDNESYVASVRSQLEQNQDIGADVVILTDWMAQQLYSEGMIVDYVDDIPSDQLPINPALIPRFYNPETKYALPYRSGYVGLAWNEPLLKQVTDGKLTSITKVEDLWHPALKGRVEVVSEMPDTMGILMRSAGLDISNPQVVKDNWSKTLGTLSDRFSSGQIRLAQGNYYINDLANEVTVATIAWYGDLVSLWNDNADNIKKFQFGFPQTGGVSFADMFVIPKTTPYFANAKELIKFYYRPEIQALMIQDIQYIPPVDGEAVKKSYLDSGKKLSALYRPASVFPSTKDMANLHKFALLDVPTNTQFRNQFKSVVGT